MAPNGYLFVNKHSNSPSLSRNTGSEASLASKVNKHVQQQRFWRSSGARRNWYRPFVRSDDSYDSTPSSEQGEFPFYEEITDRGSAASSSGERSRSASLDEAAFVRRRSSKAKRVPRSLPTDCVGKAEQQNDQVFILVKPTKPLASRPGDFNDPFSNTVLQITPTLRDVLERHLRWAVSSSITDFAVKEGIKKIFSTVLTNDMHSTAFLAMATAQQRKTADLKLPYDHSPEFYSYRATRMIRKHIEFRPDGIDPYTFVDIFRLAMCEWLNDNHEAARIHFSYCAQNYNNFVPVTSADMHNHEVISSEDVFLAIDMDKKPLLALNWEPDLFSGPPIAAIPSLKRDLSLSTAFSEIKLSNSQQGTKLMINLLSEKSLMVPIMQRCLNSLNTFPDFFQIDFASATAGPIWLMKRRLHATLHRLQSLDVGKNSVEDCIRRTLVILILLASTTTGRRIGRTDMTRLTRRLRAAMQSVKAVHGVAHSDQMQTYNKSLTRQPELWMWMCMSGAVAAKEGLSRSKTTEDVLAWFLSQTRSLVLQSLGPEASTEQIEVVLMSYLSLSGVHADMVDAVVSSLAVKRCLLYD